MALGYATAADRPALDALLALDRRLGTVVRTTREPMVGQMRLTWWHDALGRLDTAAPPAEPVLVEAAAHLIPRGIAGAELAGMIDGWEALLEGTLADPDTLTAFARGRGATLFMLAGRLSGDRREELARAGEGWALADLAANLSDPAAAATARALAARHLSTTFGTRWPRDCRGLGALALLAHLDLGDDARPAGHPLRLLRLLRFRLTGR